MSIVRITADGYRRGTMRCTDCGSMWLEGHHEHKCKSFAQEVQELAAEPTEAWIKSLQEAFRPKPKLRVVK